MSPETPEREPAAPVEAQFVERWSPRSFTDEPVTREEIASLFEAARWAPSCFNEQPWLFVYAVEEADRDRVLSVLVDANRAWAHRAPLLGIVFARREFAKNGEQNRWAAFDSGAASFSLALQAHAMGLATHFMGGFDEDASYGALGVPRKEYEAMAAFAVGHRGDPSVLDEKTREREKPSGRKDPSEVAVEGRLRT